MSDSDLSDSDTDMCESKSEYEARLQEQTAEKRRFADVLRHFLVEPNSSTRALTKKDVNKFKSMMGLQEGQEGILRELFPSGQSRQHLPPVFTDEGHFEDFFWKRILEKLALNSSKPSSPWTYFFRQDIGACQDELKRPGLLLSGSRRKALKTRLQRLEKNIRLFDFQFSDAKKKGIRKWLHSDDPKAELMLEKIRQYVTRWKSPPPTIETNGATVTISFGAASHYHQYVH